MSGIEEFTPEWFDASSVAWNLNKRRVGASYIYVCTEPLCERKVVSQKDTCLKHCVGKTSRYTRHPLVVEKMSVRRVNERQRHRQSARLLQKRRLSHSIAERVIARRRL